MGDFGHSCYTHNGVSAYALKQPHVGSIPLSLSLSLFILLPLHVNFFLYSWINQICFLFVVDHMVSQET